MTRPSAEELREACEQYPRRWHADNGISAETWQEILELLYSGQPAAYVMRKLELPEECRRSVQAHRQRHQKHIHRQIKQRFREKRIAGAPSFAELYEEARATMMEAARDSGLTPLQRGYLFRSAYLEMKELRKLMEWDEDRDREEADKMARLERVAESGVEAFRDALRELGVAVDGA